MGLFVFVLFGAHVREVIREKPCFSHDFRVIFRDFVENLSFSWFGGKPCFLHAFCVVFCVFRSRLSTYSADSRGLPQKPENVSWVVQRCFSVIFLSS